MTPRDEQSDYWDKVGHKLSCEWLFKFAACTCGDPADGRCIRQPVAGVTRIEDCCESCGHSIMLHPGEHNSRLAACVICSCESEIKELQSAVEWLQDRMEDV